jgi:hypothetical protein
MLNVKTIVLILVIVIVLAVLFFFFVLTRAPADFIQNLMISGQGAMVRVAADTYQRDLLTVSDPTTRIP